MEHMKEIQANMEGNKQIPHMHRKHRCTENIDSTQNRPVCEATVLGTEPLCDLSNEHTGMKYLNHYMAFETISNT